MARGGCNCGGSVSFWADERRVASVIDECERTWRMWEEHDLIDPGWVHFRQRPKGMSDSVATTINETNEMRGVRIAYVSDPGLASRSSAEIVGRVAENAVRNFEEHGG